MSLLMEIHENLVERNKQKIREYKEFQQNFVGPKIPIDFKKFFPTSKQLGMWYTYPQGRGTNLEDWNDDLLTTTEELNYLIQTFANGGATIQDYLNPIQSSLGGYILMPARLDSEKIRIKELPPKERNETTLQEKMEAWGSHVHYSDW